MGGWVGRVGRVGRVVCVCGGVWGVVVVVVWGGGEPP